MSRLPVIDRASQDTYAWLNQIADLTGIPDTQLAYHALRGVLFALRDCLIPDEAMDLAAQLPMLVRGIFFEGYRIAHKPMRCRSRDEFLQRVHDELQQSRINLAPEVATEIVLKVLSDHISQGEARQVHDMLHSRIQALWPKAA